MEQGTEMMANENFQAPHDEHETAEGQRKERK